MPTGEQVIAVKRQAEADLLRLPGVHAVGVGSRFVQGLQTGELVIQVFVEHKRPLAEIPESDRIPADIGGVAVDVIESPPAIDASEDIGAYRPVRGGTQIQPPPIVVGTQIATANGTLGCIAKTDKDEVVALTNYHVVSDAPNAAVNTRVWQASPTGCDDCCSSELGKVLTGTYDTDVDAALVSLRPGTEWLAEVAEIGIVTGTYVVGVNDALASYPVRKRGRTSRLTAGAVISVDYSTSIQSESGKLARNATHDMRIAPIPLFAPGDFLNLNDLIIKLSTDGKPLSIYLWGRVDATQKNVLSDPKAANSAKQSTCIAALNAILRGPAIYDAAKFTGIVLSSLTQDFIAANPAGADLIRLHRLLLEDAYPEIKPVPLFPIGDYIDFRDFLDLRKRLLKHDATNDPVSAYLWTQFKQAERDSLSDSEPISNEHGEVERFRDNQKATLTAALNTILRGPSIYDPIRFDPFKVPLSAETLLLLAKNPTGVGLIRLNRLLLEDAFSPDIAKRPAFALGGDSGSVVVNDFGEVVALLFGADSSGNAIATPIEKVKSKMKINICTAAQLGVIQKVPAAQGAGGSGRQSVQLLSPLIGGRDAEAFVRQTLSAAGIIHSDSEAEQWLRHAEEVRELIAAHRKIAAAWRRAHGPDLYRLLTGGTIGITENGRDIHWWVKRLTAFLSLLERHGSAALRADVGDLPRLVARIGGQALHEEGG